MQIHFTKSAFLLPIYILSWTIHINAVAIIYKDNTIHNRHGLKLRSASSELRKILSVKSKNVELHQSDLRNTLDTLQNEFGKKFEPSDELKKIKKRRQTTSFGLRKMLLSNLKSGFPTIRRNNLKRLKRNEQEPLMSPAGDEQIDTTTTITQNNLATEGEKSAGENVIEFTKNIANFGKGIINTTSNIGSGIGHTVLNIQDEIIDVKRTVLNVSKDLVQNVGSVALDVGANIIGNIGKTTLNLGSNVVDTGKGILKTSSNAIGNITQQVLNVGRNLISDISDSATNFGINLLGTDSNIRGTSA
ncbi:hypothetical protein PV328_004685 [Microctonus aethiopoides]|uniref:Uncharacterized protein n=1 Tax=Microctonus aethiopoides TaxID=144406 RepID=A0AA39FBA7_9HYME|nr:hypothetical protein PV328_004685 [Microctonus aethiopoides]